MEFHKLRTNSLAYTNCYCSDFYIFKIHKYQRRYDNGFALDSIIIIKSEFDMVRFLAINQNYKECFKVQMVNKFTNEIAADWLINRR